MDKKKAISLFGSGAALGRALGISRTAVGFWPKVLTTRQQDEVIGAAIRVGKITPEEAKELIEHERQRDERITSERDRSDGRRPQLESRPELWPVQELDCLQGAG